MKHRIFYGVGDIDTYSPSLLSFCSVSKHLKNYAKITDVFAIKAEPNDFRFEKPAKDEIEGLIQCVSCVVVPK